MTLYICDLPPLVALVDTRSGAPLPRLGELLPAADQRLLEMLAAGTYPRVEESDDAIDLLRLFADLLGALCVDQTTIEMFDDPDQAPLLFEFVWADGDDSDPFELPLSPYGAPAIRLRRPVDVLRYRRLFADARSRSAIPAHTLAATDCDALIDFLDQAIKDGLPVWVFREY